MTTEPLIQVSGLRKTFGARSVLENVSLEVRAGEVLALLGPNGAGKTTLLRILATLTRPTRGSAHVAGFDCVREAERVRVHIGFVAHASWTYDDLTAIENLRFWTTLWGLRLDDGRLREALAAVDLVEAAERPVRTFSAGMKRRLALARMVPTRPRVLLLDEPFAELDQRAGKRLEAHLDALKAAGGAGLMTTHSFGRGLGIADRVAILAGGRIVFDAPARTLGPDDIHRLYELHAEEGA